jgi:SAM-dependent methyltransferase
VTDPQSFDSFAEAYDRFTAIVDEPAWPWLASVGVAGAGRALDIGCGAGRRTIELASHFDEVVGVDLSAPLVELARSRRSAPNVRYEVADLSAFDDADGFDLVFSANTLHHVDPLEPALEHLRGLVRPGGTAVLLDVVDLGLAPWKKWLWRHGANRLTPVRDLPGHVARHGWRDAIEVLRFETSSPWIRHLESDRFLTVPEFERRYLSVFPDGHIAHDHWPPALVWRRQPLGAASRSTSQTTRSATTRDAGTSTPS